MGDGWRGGCSGRRTRSGPALQPLLCSGRRRWQLVPPLAGACLTSDLGRLQRLGLRPDRLRTGTEARQQLGVIWRQPGRR